MRSMPAVQRQPSACYLDDTETWHPHTWRHFRYVLVKHLRDHGAQSIEDLMGSPPTVLHLEINQSELLAVLDSARRRGLISSVDGEAGGPIFSRTRWVVTDEGRRKLRHGLPWIFDKLGVLTKVSGVIATLGLSAIFLQWLKTRTLPEVETVFEVIIGALTSVCALALFVRSRGIGVNVRRATSRDWQRWQRERPEWSEIAERGFPRRAAIAFFPVLLIPGMLARGLGLERAGVDLLTALVTCAVMIPVLNWFWRWDEIERLARIKRKEAHDHQD